MSRCLARRGLGRSVALAAVTALVGSGLAAGPAFARSVNLHGGSFTITFTQHVYAQFTLSTSGYGNTSNSVTALAPATAPAQPAFVFPITAGKLDSTFSGSVSAKRRAGLELIAESTLSGGLGFDLTSLALHLGKQSTLTVTYKRLRSNKKAVSITLATVVTTHEKHKKHGHNVTVTRLGLKLAKSGVQTFNPLGGMWKVGETLGSVTVAATTA